MATSWPTFARTDYAANKPGRNGRNTALRDRDFCMFRRPMFIEVAEQSETGTSYAVQVEFEIHLPDYVSGYKLGMILDGKVSGGATGRWKLRDKTSVTDGTEIDETSATYVEMSPSLLTIDSTWVGGLRTIEILAKIQSGSGTFNLKATDLAGLYFTD